MRNFEQRVTLILTRGCRRCPPEGILRGQAIDPKTAFHPTDSDGIAILFYMASGREAPERKPPEERARAVRVITVEPFKLVPRVTGFGSVYPGTVWSAIAQVAGEADYVHPQPQEGRNPRCRYRDRTHFAADFVLAVSQAQANIRSAEAKLAELNVTETNTTDLLNIEKRVWSCARSNLRASRISWNAVPWRNLF